MRRCNRFALAAIIAATMPLSGCGQNAPHSEAFSVTHPDGQIRQHLTVAYVFSPERRALLTKAYEAAVWKPVNAMLSGKVPYEFVGKGKVDENNHNVFGMDPDTHDIPRLPIAPDSWVWMGSRPGPNMYSEIRASVLVKLKDGQVDHSVIPDQFQFIFPSDEQATMLGPSLHFLNSNTLIPDTWTTLIGSVPHDEDFYVDIGPKDNYQGSEMLSMRQFKDVWPELKVTVGRNTSPTVDDVKRADARFIDSLSQLHLDGSDVSAVILCSSTPNRSHKERFGKNLSA